MTDHVKDQICQRIEELEKEKLELNEQLDVAQRERDALQNRPDSCRNELQAHGKPYPKSGCAVCGNGGMAGCPYEARQPSTHLARLKAKWQAEAFDHPLITPDMKAGCIGEFDVEVDHSCTACHFDGPDDDCEVCDGEVTYTRRHDVPWATQKNIFKAMCAFKAASLRRQAEGGEV